MMLHNLEIHLMATFSMLEKVSSLCGICIHEMLNSPLEKGGRDVRFCFGYLTL